MLLPADSHRHRREQNLLVAAGLGFELVVQYALVGGVLVNDKEAIPHLR